MRDLFAIPVLVTLILCSLSVARTSSSQDIDPLRAEFEKDARQAWTDLAASSFGNCAIAWVFEGTRQFGTANESTYALNFHKFARNGERCLNFTRTKNGPEDTFPVGTSRGYSSNSQYCFEVDKTKESSWQILSVEMLDGSLEYEPLPANLISGPPNSLAEKVQHEFGLDQRLIIGISGSRLDQLFARESLIFLDSQAELKWSERNEPSVGRIVRLDFRADSDRVDDALKTPRSRNRRTIMEGRIEFIADHYWCLYELDYDRTSTSSDGKPPRKHSVHFRSEYSESGELDFPSKVERIETGRSPTRNVYSMRAMTKKEIRVAKQRCYLSGYGLSEPKGVTFPWPRWVWF